MSKSKETMPSSCPKSRVTMLGTPPQVVGEKAVRYVYAAPCDLWNCPYCSRVKKAQWAKRIYFGVKFFDQYNWDFVTITSHRKLTDFESTLAVWPKAWEKLSNRLRHAYSPEYALLPEHHKDGRLHAHLIIGNAYAHITKKWIKDKGAASGFGFMNDSQKLENAEKAAFYVTKYITKTLKSDAWPVKFRRVRVSQGWPELPNNDGYAPIECEWEALMDRKPQDVAEKMEQLGYKVILMGQAKKD